MKRPFTFFIIVFLFACSNDSENNVEPTNEPPSNFVVTIASNLYDDPRVTWSSSNDPEGGVVTYSVVLDNEILVENLTTLEYDFDELLPDHQYIGKVIARDPENNETASSFILNTSPNLPPSSFNFTTINSTNVSIYAIWESSEDPEGEQVVYDIYIDDVLLAADQLDTNYFFEGLEAANTYQLKIVAKDIFGNTTDLEEDQPTDDGIYEGDISFVVQNSVDDFGALGYIEITGSLRMGGVATSSNITDLSPLSTIKRVGGNLDISFVDELTSIDGLEIESIGNLLIFRHNDGIVDMDGFNSLEQVGGFMEIEMNGQLETITGFNNLRTVDRYMGIINNINLETVSGFSALETIEDIYFYANWVLHSVDAFNSLTWLEGDLSFIQNTSLASINGTQNITHLGRLFIKNSVLTDLNSLTSLEVVEGDIDIQVNEQLQNLLGLNSLTEITYGNLILTVCTSLSSLDGLDNLTHIGNSLTIQANTILTDFCALQTAMQNFDPGLVPSINSNGYNPTVEDIANGNCSL